MPNLDAILLLEQPFVRLPFDELRRQQRTQQRLIDREMLFCASSIKDLSTANDMEKNIDTMLGRLRGLKRKLAPIADQSKQTLRIAQSRTDHLAALHAINSSSSPEFADWSRTRLDRMICDYMLRRGYSTSAAQLASTRGIHDLVDTDIFADIANVEASLSPPNPSCTLALAWCSENKTSLRKIKSPLEFDLRLQEFIELARTRSTESIKEAIAYARKHLLPLVTAPAPAAAAAAAAATAAKKDDEYDRLAHEALRKQVSRAMGLLACAPGGWAYQDLYNPHRWLALRNNFRACALEIHSLPPQPILHIALSAGLASLKVPACYESQSQNTDCPVCDTHRLGTLAREVPWSHHEISALVCSLSGRPMDEHNPPLCLPNGHVYSQSALEEIAAKSSDGTTITCPRTGDTCSFSSLRKVYIS